LVYGIARHLTFTLLLVTGRFNVHVPPDVTEYAWKMESTAGTGLSSTGVDNVPIVELELKSIVASCPSLAVFPVVRMDEHMYTMSAFVGTEGNVIEHVPPVFRTSHVCGAATGTEHCPTAGAKKKRKRSKTTQQGSTRSYLRVVNDDAAICFNGSDAGV